MQARRVGAGGRRSGAGPLGEFRRSCNVLFPQKAPQIGKESEARGDVDGSGGPKGIWNEYPGQYLEQAASGCAERFSVGPSLRWLVVSVYVLGKIFLLSGIAIINAFAELLVAH